MSQEINCFDIVKGLVNTYVKKLNLSNSVSDILCEPQRVLSVAIPVQMDDGSLKVFKGYRSQHNNALGPYKGGIRFHQDVNLDEVKALSVWMSLKCAIANIPYGGGKGGVTVNPGELSVNELERLSRGYIRSIAPLVGADLDIPAPDVGTNGQVMSWMVDEFARIKGRNEFGVITGKPVSVGGSLGRYDSTSRGVLIVIREAAKAIGLNLKGVSVAVQGFGNVGGNAVKLMHQNGGYRIVAVSDVAGGIYNPGGLDIPALMEYYAQNGTVQGFPGSQDITNEELLTINCDILVPAAVENQITEQNAHQIKAKIVAEAANGPTTPEAGRILADRKVFVLPDVLTNAGGVVVSYFEWVQNNYGYYWAEEVVNERLERNMTEAFKNVYSLYRQRKDVDMRGAAYMMAIERITEAMRMRGWLGNQVYVENVKREVKLA